MKHQMSADEIEDAVYDWQPDPHPKVRAMKPIERAAYCMLLYKAAGALIEDGVIAGMPRWRVAASLGAAVRRGFYSIEHDGQSVRLNLRRVLQ